MDQTQESPQNRRYFDQVLNSLTSGVIAVRCDGSVVSANPASCHHLGLDEMALRPGVAIDSVEGLHELAEAMREVIATGEPIRRKELTLRSDQGDRTIGMTVSPVHGIQSIEGVVFLFIDLTDMRQLERAAALNRQLAQVGELTAGVVHELRNPLSVIAGMAELLTRHTGSGSQENDWAEAIRREARQMEDLVRRFLSFARPVTPQRYPCTPEEIVDRAVTLCKAVLEKLDSSVTVSRADATGIVADGELLAQALGNVLRNGAEATGEGGNVDISGTVDEKEVVFRVVDDGPGINLESGQDLLSAFFSTKESGTGLGLSVVHRTLTAHGGEVRYGNNGEGGAWFELRLPREPLE